MRKIKKKNPLIIAAVIFSMIAGSVSSVNAQAELAKVTDYDDLPVNYVRFTSPVFSQCEFSTTNPNISIMDYYYEDFGNTPHIVYKGALNWGTASRTATKNASLGTTNVPGTFSLRANEMAVLPDGTKADVMITFSDWKIMTGERPSGVSAGQTMYMPIITDRWGLLHYITTNPKTNPTSVAGVKTSTAQRVTTTVRILERGKDTPIDEQKYPNMMIVWSDLDVNDKTVAYESSSETLYAGRFSEGIGLVSGFKSPYYVTPDTYTVSQSVDGVQKFRGSRLAEGGVISGGIFVVSPQEYSYYWYGSSAVGDYTTGENMGSRFEGSPEVTVFASAGEGGAIEKEGVTSYILNGQTTYDYAPDEGYKVKYLTVNGEDVAFEEGGGTYAFEKLLERDPSGYDHTIDVQFRRAAWNIDTSAVNGSITEPETMIPEGESRVITYKPDEGHQLVSLTVDGQPVDINEYPVSYPFMNINEDHSIKAVFEKTPAIEVLKTSDRQVYNAGDPVEYTIKVSQTVEGAEARDVIIKDTLPEGLTLDRESIKGQVQVISAEDNSYELKIDSLTDELTYTYTAVTDRDADAEELENIVTVSASNVPGDPKEGRARIKSLKPKAEITKIVSDETPDNGDEITYTISVKEPQEGVEVRNAVVTDPIPEGIELIEDSVTTEGDPATVSVSDGKIEVSIPVLSKETVISFRAKVTIEDGKATNITTLTGDDIPELKGEATIKVQKQQKVMVKLEVKSDPEPVKVETPKKEDDPVPTDKPSKNTTAKTGDEAGPALAIAAIAMLTSLLGALGLRRRRGRCR